MSAPPVILRIGEIRIAGASGHAARGVAEALPAALGRAFAAWPAAAPPARGLRRAEAEAERIARDVFRAARARQGGGRDEA